ncbi:M48 family metalloprotease [Calothrix sp. CCY 0018]|uniref:M48 family metalloprotease n=1 Tax=Calothrix sp. CCY 0018 TaxID=3103864 RepID=UPI0039C63C58
MSSHSKSSLKDGLAALKKEDYRTAKIILEDVAARDDDTNESLQAQVGLVVAYSRSGEIEMAIAVCESLEKSSNSQVQQWAENSLKQLKKKYPTYKNKKPYSTGFVAFESPEDEIDRIEKLESEFPSITTPTRTPPPPPPPPLFSNSKANTSTVKEPPVQTKKKPRGGEIVPVSQANSSSNSKANSQIPNINSNIHWRLGGRAKVWQPLPKPKFTKSIRLPLLGIGTFVALFWIVRALLQLVMQLINNILVALPFLEPIQFLYNDPTYLVLGIFLVILAVSPWLLDWLLCKFYEKKELSRETLKTYSHESVRVLQRYCQPRGWSLPKLGILPLAAPVAFTVGHLPRTARIIVSQGLLEQLEDDEIAAIIASQLGQIGRVNCAVMSVMLSVTIPIYKLYQLISQLGDNISNRIGGTVVGIIANGIYGIWYLLTATGLWLSRNRVFLSDKIGAEVTGNPNALIRGLLKIAIATASDIAKKKQTPWQLESLNLLIPVGHEQSLWLGSIAANTTFESLLMWDYLNPYRQWFTATNSHPLMGTRLQKLCKLARYWHVEPEVYLENQQSLKVKRESFLLQIAPYLGILAGAASALLFRLAWQALFALNLINLKWIYDDWQFVTGFMLIGFSIGILIRMNSLFANIETKNVQKSESIAELLTNPTALPIDSTPVELSGKLLGHRGSSNYLAQDLIIQVGNILVKLHHVSWLGQSVNPQDFIGKTVSVTGWLRRGATPWVDIQTLKTQSGKLVNSPHPIWSTILTVAAFAWGAYIVLTG